MERPKIVGKTVMGIALPTILLLSIFSTIPSYSAINDPWNKLYRLGYGPLKQRLSYRFNDTTVEVEANRDCIMIDQEWYALINATSTLVFNAPQLIPVTLENGTEVTSKVRRINASASLKVPIEQFLEIVQRGIEAKKEYMEGQKFKAQFAEPLYDGPLQKYPWYNYTYLVAPGNGTIGLKYTHLDNIETYYKGQYYKSYSLPDENYTTPSPVHHIHHSIWEIDAILARFAELAKIFAVL